MVASSVGALPIYEKRECNMVARSVWGRNIQKMPRGIGEKEPNLAF
jgi:hypothetical protein